MNASRRAAPFQPLTDVQPAALPYRLQLKALPQQTNEGFIHIEATGVCTHQGTTAERGTPILLPQQADSSLAALTYQVYPHNGTLFSVTDTYRLPLPGGEKKSLTWQCTNSVSLPPYP
jgi:hypothetical protein